MTTATTAHARELLACPFDGEKAIEVRDSGNEVWPQRFRVCCSRCDASSPNFAGSSTWAVVKSEDEEAKQNARDWWNRRTQEAKC